MTSHVRLYMKSHWESLKLLNFVWSIFLGYTIFIFSKDGVSARDIFVVIALIFPAFAIRNISSYFPRLSFFVCVSMIAGMIYIDRADHPGFTAQNAALLVGLTIIIELLLGLLAYILPAARLEEHGKRPNSYLSKHKYDFQETFIAFSAISLLLLCVIVLISIILMIAAP